MVAALFLTFAGFVAIQDPAPETWPRAGGELEARGGHVELAAEMDGETRPWVLEGRVLDRSGRPAVGARVTSSAGGSALTDGVGAYRLELEVPVEARALWLFAEGVPDGRQRARREVRLLANARWMHPEPLELGIAGVEPPRWLPTFGEAPGMDDSTVRRVLALAEYDDGTGPALFAAGAFGVAGSADADNVAKWNGQRWEGLDSGLNGTVSALAVHDDGSGRELFVGGSFSRAGGQDVTGVVKWDGSRWASVGSGLRLYVTALAVHDDGAGPALYAAGQIDQGPVLTPTVLKWDGASWTPLGSGMDQAPVCLVSHDDGSGRALYAGGGFTTAGGSPARALARWNGSSWAALPSEVNGSILALQVHDDGTGPALFAGGLFGTAGGVLVRSTARWNGQSWSPLGGGVNGAVESLASFDDGGGSALYAGGTFTTADGASAAKMARWDGAGWTPLGSGLEEFNSGVAPTAAYAMAVAREGGVPALFVGGTFNVAGRQGASFVARWTSAGWSPLGRGLSGAVKALALFDDGTGPALHAAGDLISADGAVLNHVAKREGNRWVPLGSGIGHTLATRVNALAVHDDGRGPALYAGGLFSSAGGVSARRIARWDGQSWSALGAGVDSGSIADMVVFDDGTGPALFVCGDFTTAGGMSARRIAKWDGQTWSPLGTGMDGPVNALAVFDDGHGPALYAGGAFITAGGVSAQKIAKWDGSTWAPLGAGLQGSGIVGSLGVHDDGTGPALFVGGNFTRVGGVNASCIARWDGTGWTALGAGANNSVWALASHDDGQGRALYAGGIFTTAGGAAISRIARWDGASWSALESGVDAGISQGVFALLSHDDGRGPALHAGGSFWSASHSGDSFLARWGLSRRSTFVLDFETEDDFESPLVNGQHVDSEFGTLVGLAASGPNAGLAIFDSTVGGPNDPSQDRDLLVGSGNLLILQTENLPPDANDVFPRPNDDEDGGTLTLNFARPLEARSLALVDLDAGDGLSFLYLRDVAGRRRVFRVPPDWTGDRLVAGPGRGVLDLTTLEPQPGFGSVVTADEEFGFDGLSVVGLSLELAGSGALDDVTLAGEDLPLPQAASWLRNGSGVNPQSLRALSLPVLGSPWRSTLDCTAEGPGLAVLEVRRSSTPGVATPFGQALIDGELVFRATRLQPGAPCALAWPIPLDMALVGLEVHAQGLCLGSGSPVGHASQRRARLSNAVGLRLGF